MLNKMTFLKNKTFISFFIIYLLLASFDLFVNYRGRDFPNQNQLQYATGTLYTEYIPPKGKSKSIFNVYLYFNDLGKNQVFECDYGGLDPDNITDCNKNLIEPYDRQDVVIGWYQPKSILWYQPPVKQLVTLTVGNKQVISYQDTLATIPQKNRQVYAHMIFLPFAFTLMLYTFFLIMRFIFRDIKHNQDNVI